MSHAIPELDELGQRLGEAIARPPRRARWMPPRRLAAAVALVGAVGVPAYAGQHLLAPLVEGETPLPSQAPAGAHTLLAASVGGPAGPYRLVGYPSQLHGRPDRGICLFLTTVAGGTGVCGPIRMRRDLLATSPQFEDAVFVARVSDRVAAVRVTGGRAIRSRSPRPIAADVPGAGSVNYVIVALAGLDRRRSRPQLTVTALGRDGRVLDRATVGG